MVTDIHNKRAVILISANAEWRSIKRLFPLQKMLTSPFGEYFYTRIGRWECTFFYSGWGKVSAAASTQYVIDIIKPDLLVNLGSCGGFTGEIERGEVVLVEKTLVYDIIEQMGDFEEHIAFYTTDLDLSWLKEPYPARVRRSLMVSGDRDLLSEDVVELKRRYHAIAGDWESGAIAWTAKRNGARLLILRGVTDLVNGEGSTTYIDLNCFEKAAFEIMEKLVKELSGWLEIAS